MMIDAELNGRITACKVRVLRAAKKFAKLMAEFDGHPDYCSEAMEEVLDSADRLIELERSRGE